MPLRFLMYLSDLYSKLTSKQNLYGTKLIKIPTPRFAVFYNGQDERPECEILRLSDAYMVKETDVSLELVAWVLNINAGYNKELKNACKTLSDYSKYVQLVRTHRSEGDDEELSDGSDRTSPEVRRGSNRESDRNSAGGAERREIPAPEGTALVKRSGCPRGKQKQNRLLFRI